MEVLTHGVAEEQGAYAQAAPTPHHHSLPSSHFSNLQTADITPKVSKYT